MGSKIFGFSIHFPLCNSSERKCWDFPNQGKYEDALAHLAVNFDDRHSLVRCSSMQECTLGLSFSKWQFSASKMVRKVSRVQCVISALLYDASVCALSIGTHASRYRIGTDWYALFLCCLSRGVLSVESNRMKASLVTNVRKNYHMRCWDCPM